MKSTRWAWMTGPLVIAGSLLVGMTMMHMFTNLEWVSGNQFFVDKIEASLIRFENITGNLVDELARNGTGPCYEQHTNYTKVIGLSDELTLATDHVHKFWLHSYTRKGELRCAGGDYYELELSSPLWRSRPLSEDLRNGTYSVELMVPNEFAGTYNFSAILLFDANHGLDYDGTKWSILERTVSFSINFVRSGNESMSLERCRSSDFRRREWCGRWTRPLANDSCTADSEGRFSHCFSGNSSTWSSGDVATLESMGWSYSAHCAFHIFQAQEAWDCLAGRWLFFWGDSNHQDTIRNLLTFVLGIKPLPGRDLLQFVIDRSYQNWFRNPEDVEQELRISSHFNGHPMVDNNGMGFASLEDPFYRKYVADFFKGTRYPDAMIMNSGLHDGLHHHNLVSFTKSVDMALEFWHNVFGKLAGEAPKLVYRTTVAPAGTSRGMQANPHKMEIYNRIATEQVQRRFPWTKFVDAFDMSFPFHYDNNYSDGGHYGRPPHHPHFQHPHFYFVDVMLAHVLLNTLCPTRN